MVMAVDGDLDFFQKEMLEAVVGGVISEERIDDAVKRILRQKYRLGLFEKPYPDHTLIDEVGIPLHRDVARQAVRESLVLLKNENETLPISIDAKKIVVVGEHANNSGFQSGGWTIAWQGTRESYKRSTTILAGIKEMTSSQVVYDSIAKEQIFDADIAIIVVGETPYAEFMGDVRDSTSNYQLTLTKEHQYYIELYAKKVDNIIVVLVSGRPLVVTDQINISDAFVAAWYPGSEGKGVAEVLFGSYNFTGKLPHSWPKSVADFDGKYGPNFWDNSITPLYEFGYGLTY